MGSHPSEGKTPMSTTIAYPTKAHTAHLAERLWVRRQRRQDFQKTSVDDWCEAEQILSDPWLVARIQSWFEPEDILWQLWARDNLRPYLAIEVAAEPKGLVNTLQRAQRSQAGKTFLIAVLDGAPEAGRAAYRRHLRGEVAGDPSPSDTEPKDDLFYRLCYTSCCLYLGVLVDQEPCSIKAMKSLKPRTYQDGCAVAFPAKAPLHHAVTAAARLLRVLSNYNIEKHLSWKEQLHARVSIGSSWEQAVCCLPHAERDEIVIASECLDGLDATYRQLCLATGARPGPANNSSSQEPSHAAELAKISEYLQQVPRRDPVVVPPADPVDGHNGH